MNKTIKEITKEEKIKEKRDNNEYIRRQMYLNERRMSKLTFDRNVGLYAHHMDEYFDLLPLLDTPKREEILERLKVLSKKLEELKDYDGVKEYSDLRLQNILLKFKLSDYYKTINLSFRNKINLINSLNIYVDQNDYLKHITDLDNIKILKEECDTIIKPKYDLTSKRDLRHFYNKLSFKYLESLSEDYNFELENKELGKVRILK